MASFGTLIARVYTSRAQIPLQGAAVAVTQRSGNGSGRHTLLALRVSDESGITAPVSIPTPASGGGVSPGGETPFALCDLWAESPGFELLVVRDVQIFPGVETVQDLELIPPPEQATPHARAELVQITPQDL